MRRGLAVSIVLSVSLLNPAAVFSQEPVDRAVIAKIRDEGLNRSQAPETFAYLTEVIGPRFTGSPAYKTAAEWARDKLKEWGLENPHLVMGQPIQTSFEREDRPQPTLASGPVAIGQPRPAGGNPAQTNQQNVTRIIREAGAGVVLRPNRGEHGTLFVLGRDSGEGAVPSVVLSAEHYNMIAWLEPFRDLGARRNISQGIGNTDHLSFIRAGVPGFNVVQDYTNYDVRTHHTNMDTFERVREADLRQAAIVMASFIYHASMRQQKIPPGKR